MIHQNDGRMRDAISRWGCYYFSLMWISNHYNNIGLSAEILNSDMYYQFQKKEWMTDTCFIKNPVAILNWAGPNVKSVNKILPEDYVAGANDIVVGFWKREPDIGHFVVMDGDCVAYDPWWSPQGGSRAVREGRLDSLRVFRR